MKQNQNKRRKNQVHYYCRDLNISQSVIDRTSRQKVSKNIIDLNSIINQLDLIDICRIFHPTKAAYIFFSSSHGTFIKTDDILGHKTNLIFLKEES